MTLFERVDPDALALADEMAALALHRPLQLGRNRPMGDHGGLIGAEDRVVERFAMGDVTGRFLDVGPGVHVVGAVPGADPEGRIAGPVSRADHRSAAGRQDHAGAARFHQAVDDLQVGIGNDLDDPVGGAP